MARRIAGLSVAVMVLLWSVLVLSVAPVRAQMSQFVGNWTNEDPNTGGVTRLEIQLSGGTPRIQAWGKCTPTDCDWGRVTAYAYGHTTASDAVTAAEALSATFRTGFSETVMIIRPSGSRLRADVLTRFTDGSGRGNYISVYTFVRSTGPGPAARLPAPALISPASGAVFSHFPRTTTLVWAPVAGAASYTLEIDCMHCCTSGQWCADVGRQWRVQSGLHTTSFTFDFVGAQPGRWRVWAVDAAGNDGFKSGWREFRYTR